MTEETQKTTGAPEQGASNAPASSQHGSPSSGPRPGGGPGRGPGRGGRPGGRSGGGRSGGGGRDRARRGGSGGGGGGGGAGGRRFFRRRKVCRFCVERVDTVDYKDPQKLEGFCGDRGKILPRRLTGVCTVHQRQLKTAIKRARNCALLPFAASQ